MTPICGTWTPVVGAVQHKTIKGRNTARLSASLIGGNFIVGTVLGVDIIMNLLDDLGERLTSTQDEVRIAIFCISSNLARSATSAGQTECQNPTDSGSKPNAEIS